MSAGGRNGTVAGGERGAGVLARLVLVRPGEGPALVWSAAYFFLLLFSYYLQRPFRDALGIRGDLDRLPWLWTATSGAMLVAAPLFSLLVSRLPRRTFIPLVYRVYGLNLLLFYALFVLMPPGWRTGLGYAYYVWLSVCNLLTVSVFWGFMSDIFSPEQGKRLFGFLAVGGTLGAIAGGSVPAVLAAGATVAGLGEVRLSPESLLLVAVVGIELATQCVRRLSAIVGLSPGGAALGRVSAPLREPGRGVWTGIMLIARSPYLAVIALYMLAFTVTSTFLWFEQLGLAKRIYADDGARTAFFARLDVAANVLTLLTQVFVTGRLVRALGVGVALSVVPVLTGAGFALMAAEPTIGVLSAVYVLRRAAHYALDRPSREMLYTPLGPEEKYKSKSFIDTFVYRGGDLLGAWTHGVASAAAGGLAAIVVPLSIVWLGGAVFLGRRQRALAAGRPPEHRSGA